MAPKERIKMNNSSLKHEDKKPKGFYNPDY